VWQYTSSEYGDWSIKATLGLKGRDTEAQVKANEHSELAAALGKRLNR
jgi:hypothetical protein